MMICPNCKSYMTPKIVKMFGGWTTEYHCIHCGHKPLLSFDIKTTDKTEKVEESKDDRD